MNSYRNNPSNNFKLISANTGNITLSGQPAYHLLFTYTPQTSYAGLSKQLEVGILLNNQGYIIDYFGNISLFSKFLPQVQQIIKTFEIHRPNVYAQQRGLATVEQPAQQEQSQAAAGVTPLVDKGIALFRQGNLGFTIL
ncbi:MAG: hypothetical protein WA667_17560 [Candidatus Nitrosopolaris sp.]